MEELRDAAMAYYENLTEQQKQLAKKLFNAADTNGDGTVNVLEYFFFLREQNFAKYVPRNLFNMLDKNGDGAMDFEEFVTLYYIVKVRGGIKYCDSCGAKLLRLYFLCVECYQAGGGTYDLCCKCYRKKVFRHKHSTFLDNYALLDGMQPTKTTKTTQGNTSRENRGQLSNTQMGNTKGNTMREVKQALDAFEKCVRFADTAFEAVSNSDAALEAFNLVSNCATM